MIRSLPLIPFLLFTGIFVAMTVGLIVIALRTRGRAQVMASMPTSNVGFATDGYVELEGHAQAVNGRTIPAPLTGAACVWYHARLEHWTRTTKSDDSRSWVTVRDATSGDPFLLQDASGACLVLPDGADVTFTDRSVWFGSTPDPQDKNPPKTGPGESPEGNVRVYGTPGKEYRYTEERIYAGDPLYALGQFSTVRWQDDDEDDDDEADVEPAAEDEAAWDFVDREYALKKDALAITSRRLSRPASQPFLLSTTPQAKLQAVYGQGWKGALFIALVPAALAALLLWLRYA
jgi:hypothetical protein